MKQTKKLVRDVNSHSHPNEILYFTAIITGDYQTPLEVDVLMQELAAKPFGSLV